MPGNGETGHTGPSHRRTQAERSATTRGALISAGRALFAERGYAGTAREEIVERAGVTRGALHHHFGTKQALFAAAFEALEQELATRIATAAMAGTDPLDQLRRGCHEFLDAALDPAVQRIVLLDAPAVLGWAVWREVDARYGLGLVTEGLRAVFAAHPAPPPPVEPLAHLLLAALNEAAMLVAGAPDPERARADVGAIIDQLLESLTR
jgi:AcrR family transcriptional regulator